MSNSSRILVTGAGGFIGHHLVKELKRRGHWVRGADLKRPEFEATAADEFLVTDLRLLDGCLEATREVDQVFALAADMGGMGFISANHAKILYTRISILVWRHRTKVGKTRFLNCDRLAGLAFDAASSR